MAAKAICLQAERRDCDARNSGKRTEPRHCGRTKRRRKKNFGANCAIVGTLILSSCGRRRSGPILLIFCAVSGKSLSRSTAERTARPTRSPKAATRSSSFARAGCRMRERCSEADAAPSQRHILRQHAGLPARRVASTSNLAARRAREAALKNQAQGGVAAGNLLGIGCGKAALPRECLEAGAVARPCGCNESGKFRPRLFRPGSRRRYQGPFA